MTTRSTLLRPVAVALDAFGRRPVLPLLILVGLVCLWQALAQLDQSRIKVIPAPSEIAAAAWRTQETLLTRHIPATLLVTALGTGIAVAFGLVVATALDFSPLLRRAVYPLLIASQTIPTIALATILVMIFGFALLPKVIVVVLFCFFPVMVNTIDGLAATDPDLLALLRSMGATSWQRWRMVRFPAALPSFFSGLRVAMTYSVTGAITSEYVMGSQDGLGQYLRAAYQSGKTDQAFAAIAIVALLSIALVLIVSAVERLALPWFFSQARSTHWNEPGIY
ncbi:MAG: ABC transporter permease [Anaerolineae bacterium]|nr:ABC transporter permease [Anaerolineae bacterium]